MGLPCADRSDENRGQEHNRDRVEPTSIICSTIRWNFPIVDGIALRMRPEKVPHRQLCERPPGSRSDRFSNLSMGVII